MSATVAVERLGAATADGDFQACARIHREEISGGFLSSLGGEFLTLLYRTLAVSRHSFLFVARREGQILGLICGSDDTSAVYREFALRGGLRTLALLAPRLLSPRRIARALETVLYPSRQRGRDLPHAEILNFCVSATSQGTGVGRALFGALAEEFRSRGIGQIKIVTGVDQASAQAFYSRAGATLVGNVAVHHDSPELVYVYDVAPVVGRPNPAA